MQTAYPYDTNQLLKELNQNLVASRITPWVAFRNGILAGLGTVIGATLVLAIAVGILSRFVDAPLIGGYVKQIVDVVERKNTSEQ